MPSFILIYPTVWPQCTNVTDRTDKTDRTHRQTGERFNSIWRTVLQTVAQKSKNRHIFAPVLSISTTFEMAMLIRPLERSDD